MSAERVRAWVADHAKDFEVTAQRRDADNPMVDRALELVRAFIVERGLILFGGLAIDYALRLRGAQLYPDDERPDFDVLSPRSVDDAYDLVDRLAAAGFAGAGAVRAIHVQTMRVRTDYLWVADVGHVPRDVFDRLPTLEYRGMRVIHPDFQRMDQLLAFCFPMNGPPFEDIFHRWAKDLARFNLYEDHYPICGRAAPGRPTATITARLRVPVAAARPGVALQGFAAYAALHRALRDLAAELGAAADVAAPPLALGFPDAHTVSVEVPAALRAGPVVFAGPDPAAALGPAEWFDPYLDIFFESARAGGALVMSTAGRLLAAGAVTLAGGPPLAGLHVRVVTPPFLLMWFLYQAFQAEDAEAKSVYREYYCHTLELMAAAEALCGDAARLAATPFAPTVETLGAVNHNAAYIIKMAANAEKLRDTPPALLELPDVAGLLRGLPLPYYAGKARPAFDYSVSPFFRRSGVIRAESMQTE